MASSKIPRRGGWTRYIQVKQGTQAVSSSGAAKLDWSNPTTVISGWAKRSGTFGTETDRAGKEVAEMQYVYETGYRSGVLPEMRLYDRSQVMDIVSVAADQENWVMLLTCRENLNG